VADVLAYNILMRNLQIYKFADLMQFLLLFEKNS